MRGVLLAGGVGSRMGLFTRRVGNKHVIPVYNRPMIEYPLSSLSQAGVKELAIVTSNHHAGDICKLIGDGKEFGFDSVQYFVQIGEGGIAAALKLTEKFCNGEKFAVILGDNFFEMDLTEPFKLFEEKWIGCSVFLKQVHDPYRFGVAEISGDSVLSIEEKPLNPKSDLAITGLYLMDWRAFQFCKDLKPSARGELEVTDILKEYVRVGEISFSHVDGFWSDTGTPDSLLAASNWIKENESRMIVKGRFKNYRFKLGDDKCGDYISNG